MKMGPERVLWAAALAVLGLGYVRLARLPDPYAPGVRTAVEDRRLYRFRDWSWGRTERLFFQLVDTAEAAADPVERGRVLARLSALQRERGLIQAADILAGKAIEAAPADPETRRLLQTPLDPAQL